MTELAWATEHEDRLHGLDEGSVHDALKVRNPKVPVAELTDMARVVSLMSEFVVDLSKIELSELASEPEQLRAALEEATQSVGRLHIQASGAVERPRGAGLGEMLSPAEGRARLAGYARPKPLEDWAGPVAGAGEIEKQLGIPRSTLNSWYRDGAVVGLLRGQRKLAYPLEQFVDGRPLKGLAAVLRVAPDARSAWLWLRQVHGALDGATPLRWLRNGCDSDIAEAAKRDFA